MDPVDLLCGYSAAMAAAPYSPAAMALEASRFPPYAGHLHQHAAMPTAAYPLTPLSQAPPTLVAAVGPPGLTSPPGLETSELAPGGGHSMAPPLSLEAQIPPPSAALSSPMIQAWALEAKMLQKTKAEEAHRRQVAWAEKMQTQYLQGQEVLKALQEPTPQPKGVGAFDRFVDLMGLNDASPAVEKTPGRSDCGDLLSEQSTDVGEMTPAKAVNLAALFATPPKDGEVTRRGRWVPVEKEKENMPSTGRGWRRRR